MSAPKREAVPATAYLEIDRVGIPSGGRDVIGPELYPAHLARAAEELCAYALLSGLGIDLDPEEMPRVVEEICRQTAHNRSSMLQDITHGRRTEIEQINGEFVRAGLAGGVWAGGQSYINAFKKYADKSGLARVRRTLTQMPVRESYHIDVLTAVPMRRDYNPAAPESTADSIAGKTAIVREFNARGMQKALRRVPRPVNEVVGELGQLRHPAAHKGALGVEFSALKRRIEDPKIGRRVSS